MAFVSSSSRESKNISCDIVCIPAISGDPITTFSGQWLCPRLSDLIPKSRVLLYDHHTVRERAIVPTSISHANHKETAEEYGRIQEEVSQFTLDVWAQRLATTLSEYRNLQTLRARSTIFICHSTGGIVLKEALSRELREDEDTIAATCIGIAFFSTPHHGSKALSAPDLARGIGECLNLKFEMGPKLCKQFSTRNLELELLNAKFCDKCPGIQIWNFLESQKTEISTLINSPEGESLISIVSFVVDSLSATLSTDEDPIEEERLSLATNHVGVIQFLNDHGSGRAFVEDLKTLVEQTRITTCGTLHGVVADIFSGCSVYVHQFYKSGIEDSETINIRYSKPSLREFRDLGPSKILKTRPASAERERILPHVEYGTDYWHLLADEDARPVSSGKPSMDIRRTKEDFEQTTAQTYTSIPRIIITDVDDEADTSISVQLTTADTPRNLGALSTQATHDEAPNSRGRAPRSRILSAGLEESDRFKWIHVPANVCAWVPRILKTVSEDKGSKREYKRLIREWQLHENRSRHASTHSRFIRTHSKVFPKQNANGEIAPASPTVVQEPQLVVNLPYLHWDTFDGLTTRAAIIKRRSDQVHSWPLDPDVTNSKSLELKLIWQYLKSKSPIHLRRTLDQFGYPTLRNTEARDKDQVLYKQTRPAEPDTLREAPDPKNTATFHKSRASGVKPDASKSTSSTLATVLMVDTLWLFVLDSEAVVSFATCKETREVQSVIDMQADLRQSIYDDASGEHAQSCTDSFDLAGLAILHCVTVLLERASDPNLQVFRIFEEYISELTEAQTRAFKHFRDNHRYQSARDRKTNHLDLADNREDLSNLLELRDVEDELTSIQKLLTEQLKILQEMIRQFKDINRRQKGLSGTKFLQDAHSAVLNYLEHVTSMLKSSQVAQAAFEKLLDMKQKQANVMEAHMAREQTEVAAEQSRSVMIFTIFTIVFLPLSFFSSVFGMNAKEWSGTDTNPDLNYIIKVMGSVSVGVIVIALFMAFNLPTRRFVHGLWDRTALSTVSALNYIPEKRPRKTADRFDSNDRELPSQPPKGRRSKKLKNRGSKNGLKQRFAMRQYGKGSSETEIFEDNYEV